MFGLGSCHNTEHDSAQHPAKKLQTKVLLHAENGNMTDYFEKPEVPRQPDAKLTSPVQMSFRRQAADRSEEPAGLNAEDRISAVVASKRPGSGDQREGYDALPVGPLVLQQLLPVLPCPHGNHHPGGLVHGEPRYLCRHSKSLDDHAVLFSRCCAAVCASLKSNPDKT